MDIEINNLYKAFDDKKVFKDFSCVIKENEITVLMGASGGGKTTLISILAGLENADSGVIKGLSKKKLSIVFQEDRLCENLSPVSNVKLVCSSKVSKKDIIKSLCEVGLADSLSQPARELSGGMKRRVAIVRALMADFDLLILDEPFKGLDEKTKGEVMNFVKEKTVGKTVIMVTHEQSEATILEAKIITI